MPRQITIDTIRDAARSVYAAARRTPLVTLDESGTGNASTGRAVHLKLETLQPIGSFKIRGAYNAVRRLTPEILAGGIWTVSAGNAAQGVALAARTAGAPCSILVIETAPRTKIDAIARLGATIVRASYDECWEVVEQHRSDRLPGHFVHPFDDDAFISGNGTVGLEIVEDLPDVDAIIASVGGGGLLAGVATAARALRPSVRILAAEPETAAPLHASLARGDATRLRGLAAVVRRRVRRQVGHPDHVAAPPRPGRRLDRRLARRGEACDAPHRGAHPRHRRRRGRVRGGGGIERGVLVPARSRRSSPAATSTSRRSPKS